MLYAPEFWNAKEPPWQVKALAPLGFAYHGLTRLRFALARAYRSKLPVVCVGNFVAGGAGKTPTALALGELLRAEGLSPAFLSRGYGGKEAGPLQVDPERHDAERVGDEPLLLTRLAPTIVSRKRPAGARMAETIGADVIVMDDGLQNPSLAKTASFAVLDAETAVGNGRVIPAGPLRARLDFQLRLTDAIVLIGGGRAGEALAARAEKRSIPVFRATMSGRNIGGLAGQRVVGFAGIARPEKFFASLQALGAEIVAGRGFPDHHPYSEHDAKELLMLAGRENALLVSTEKDLARLKGGTGAPGRLAEVTRPLLVSLIFDDAEGVVEFLRDKGALANHGEK